MEISFTRTCGEAVEGWIDHIAPIPARMASFNCLVTLDIIWLRWPTSKLHFGPSGARGTWGIQTDRIDGQKTCLFRHLQIQLHQLMDLAWVGQNQMNIMKQASRWCQFQMEHVIYVWVSHSKLHLWTSYRWFPINAACLQADAPYKESWA